MHDCARPLWTVLLLSAALAFTGCAAATAPTTTAAAATVTDTFNGTLSQTGSLTHNFRVGSTGELTVTLTSVSPLATMALGIGIMTSDGTSCIGTMTQNDNARANNTAALQGTVTSGNYCIRVYDSGNIPLSTTVDYTVTVLHP
jgi:hypothetical protein